jgi:hypothetical protein
VTPSREELAAEAARMRERFAAMTPRPPGEVTPWTNPDPHSFSVDADGRELPPGWTREAQPVTRPGSLGFQPWPNR